MRDLVILALICLVLAVGSLVGFLVAVTHEQMLALDGLLLTLISLLLCGLFTFNLVWLVLRTPLREAIREALGKVRKLRPQARWKALRAAEVKVPQEDSKSSQG